MNINTGAKKKNDRKINEGRKERRKDRGSTWLVHGKNKYAWHIIIGLINPP